MNKILVVILLLITYSLNGQFLKSEDFHSDFEKRSFDQVLAGKTMDPSIFLFTTNPENGFNEYQDYVLHLKSISKSISDNISSNEDMRKMAKKVFKTTQKQSFKRYVLYKNLDNLLKDGNYNCISGTAFYALIFKDLGFETHIYETPYHVFLEIENENGERILIESTDKAFGVIDKDKSIEKRRLEYSIGEMNFIPQGLGSNGDPLKQSMLKEIDLVKLAALQYYNSAVVEFNSGNFENASKLLKKSSYLYPSSRIILLQMLSDKMTASLN